MAGYSARQSTYTTSDTITAADTNDEFTVILAAFDASGGHAHDGTAGGGPLLLATGALNVGSITSGFGAIDNGTSNITSGGVWSVDVDGSAISSAGAITFGIGADAAIYWDATNFVIDTSAKLDISVSGTSIATWDGTGLDLASGDAYLIGTASVLNATTLGTAVVASSLTSVGTIATGVWNGTIVAEAYLENQSGTNTGDEVAASLTAAGVIEIATPTEVNTGSDDTRAVSPVGLTAWTGDTAIVTVGAIGTGSITSGFTSIDIGSGTLSATGTITGPSGTWDSGGMDLATTDTYAIAGTDVLNATTLGSAVVASSLTSVGTLTGLTMGGTITGGGNLIDNGLFRDMAETTIAKGNFGATPAWDVSTGNAQWGTVDQAITSSTMTNWPATGKTGYLALEVINGAAFSIVWPTSVDWVGGTAPTLTTAGTDQLIFRSRDAGTTVLGWVAGLDIK